MCSKQKASSEQPEARRGPTDTARWSLWTFVLCLALSAHLSASASGKRVAPLELYKQVLQANIECMTADDHLYQYMQNAADKFARICFASGRLPQSESEEQFCTRKLLPLILPCPYGASKVLQGELSIVKQSIATETTARLYADPGLSPGQLEQLFSGNPDQWRLFPGSIVVLHNTENVFAVIGFGIDGKPLRDSSKSNTLRVVFRTINFH